MNERIKSTRGCSTSKLAVRYATICASAFSAFALLNAADGRPLNDTGEIRCSNGLAYVDCSTVATTHPGQDARYGRDVAAGTSALTKRPNSFGAGGFEFIKVSNTGAELPETAQPGMGAGQYACVKDVVTGLLWLLEVTIPLGTWHDPNPNTNGGDSGVSGTNSTSSLVSTANQAGYCGRTSWRIPTVREGLSIINFNSGCPGSLADPVFIRAIPAQGMWTSQTVIGAIDLAYNVRAPGGSPCIFSGKVLKSSPFTPVVVVSG